MDTGLEFETENIFGVLRQKKIRTLLELLRLEGQAFCQALHNLDIVMNLAGRCQSSPSPVMAELLQIHVRKLSKCAALLDNIGLRMSAIKIRKI